MAPRGTILCLRSPMYASAVHPPVLSCFAPSVFRRYASGHSKDKAQSKKKKKRTEYKNMSLRNMPQFSLCDAMRYIRAFEVGRDPISCKYDLAVRLRTKVNGQVVRNRLRLPHAVDTALRICVICPPDSPAATLAQNAGASLIGEENVFDAIKEGRIDFDRCICHSDSAEKFTKAGLGRILGPKGLMPSSKTGTMTDDVAGVINSLIGSSEYRERMGVVRCAVGRLAFTPQQLKQNVGAFMQSIKKDMASLSEKISKEIHEVVLSSTNAPGFSLNGDFRSPTSPPTSDLSII